MTCQFLTKHWCGSVVSCEAKIDFDEDSITWTLFEKECPKTSKGKYQISRSCWTMIEDEERVR